MADVTDMTDMFAAATLSIPNYNALLNGWSAQTLQSGVTFHGGNSKYSQGGTAGRADLTGAGTHNWTITTDGGSVSAFISSWTTTGASETVTLPLINGGTHTFTVDWGDGSSSAITAWNDAAKTHTYANAGTYNVAITGTMGAWSFDYDQNLSADGDQTKLQSIAEWGPFSFNNAVNNFISATSLSITATDIPDLTGVTSLQGAFFGASSITSIPNMGSWDVSAVQSMRQMFQNARNFSEDISNWNVSSVTDFSEPSIMLTLSTHP